MDNLQDVLETARRMFESSLLSSCKSLLGNLISQLRRSGSLNGSPLLAEAYILLADCLAKHEPKRAIASLPASPSNLYHPLQTVALLPGSCPAESSTQSQWRFQAGSICKSAHG